MESTMLPRLLRADEVATMLGVSLQGVYRRTADGTLPHVYIGRFVRYPAHEIEAWLAEQPRGGPTTRPSDGEEPDM